MAGVAVTADAGLVDRWRYIGGDTCADFFTLMLKSYSPSIPHAAHVLEVGCAELDWLSVATQSWPEMTITGIDWRGHKKPPQTATVIKGDVRETDRFEAQSFDWVVSISALEHIGLGHYSRDPLDPDGDAVALRNIYRWLKPGGWLSFDVPWNAGPEAFQVCGSSHRVYDDATVQSRLAQGLGWHQAWTGIADDHQTRVLLPGPVPAKTGGGFYYRGFWWQKPHAK